MLRRNGPVLKSVESVLGWKGVYGGIVGRIYVHTNAMRPKNQHGGKYIQAVVAQILYSTTTVRVLQACQVGVVH